MNGLERMDKPTRWPWVVGMVLVVLLLAGVAWLLGQKSHESRVASRESEVGNEKSEVRSQESEVRETEKPVVLEVADKAFTVPVAVPAPQTVDISKTNNDVIVVPVVVADSQPSAVAVAAAAEELIAAGKKDTARDQYLVALASSPDKALRSDLEQKLGALNVELIRHPWPMAEKQDVVVQDGDSIKAIARKFGTTVELIVKGNELKRPDVIRPRQHLKVFSGKMAITVSKARNDLLLTVDGRFFKRYHVGTGRYDKTPVGSFVIAERIPEPPWWRDDGHIVPFGDKENILGTRWMAIKATGTTPEIKGYGIHGTWDTNSIGKAESAGCIRLRNEDVEELFELVPLGTPVVIEE